MDPKIPTDKKHQLVKDLTPQEVTVEMLTELDRLVQLLESPIFTPLRMEVCVPHFYSRCELCHRGKRLFRRLCRHFLSLHSAYNHSVAGQ